jgi:hypothetical protein
MSSPGTRTLLVLSFFTASLFAAPPAKLTEAQLAERIDELIEKPWKKEQVKPAPITEDAAFIRRAFLDLAGRIPNILEVRDFLDDDRPDKRRIWVDDLLKGIRKDGGGDTYSDHFASAWGEWIIPPAAAADEQQRGYLSYAFQNWLRPQLRDNLRYDELVKRIILANSNQGQDAGVFFQANENKPENLASATARLFLGIRLECAQCHDDRSGGNWSREQFWEMTAFFGPQRKIDIPGTKTTVEARFLDGTKPDDGVDSSRAQLAKWITSADNPYFSRAIVNRVWAYLFGVGIIDPFDDRGDQNPPSHPELLDEMAEQFVQHDFDLKYLLRSLVLTKAYQRVSTTTDASQDRPRLFARMPVRGLSASQLFDSLAEATEYRADRATPVPQFDGTGRLSPRQDFLVRFTTQDRSTEMTTSILQALYLMNGSFMSRATSLENNRTLATIADAARISNARRLETLFLVALSRKPTEAELKRLVPYVDKGGPSKNSRKALSDVFWALLNSAEFRLNH